MMKPKSFTGLISSIVGSNFDQQLGSFASRLQRPVRVLQSNEPPVWHIGAIYHTSKIPTKPVGDDMLRSCKSSCRSNTAQQPQIEWSPTYFVVIPKMLQQPALVHRRCVHA